MTLTITQAGKKALLLSAEDHLSNKPETSSPNGKICKAKFQFSDGRTVWRSHLMPDRLALVGYFAPKYFPASPGGTGNLDADVWDLAEGLKGATECGVGSGWVSQSGSKVGEFQLACGNRQASVYTLIKRHKAVDQTGFHYSMRMEFNPRKLGAQGIEDLLGIFDMASSKPFAFGLFLANAHVTRLDAAIDFVGVAPSELLVTAPNEGKRIDYHAQESGRLESFQLHGKMKVATAPKKKLLSPAGPLLIKVYDRNAERAAHGKPPPIPGHQVTRAEVVRKNLGVSLAKALEEKPLIKARVSYAPACSPWADLKRWDRYLAFRAARGRSEAGQLLGLSQWEREVAEKAIAKHANNLLADLGSPAWEAGVAPTGLPILLGATTQ